MLMAARKLQGIGLVLLVLICLMIFYPMSLNVAATRSELADVNQQVDRTRASIRYLESELAVRASMGQLDRWNAESFGYSAPDADQYLGSERDLASIDRLPRARGASDVEPVLLAMVSPVGPPAGSADQAAGTPARDKPAAKPADVANDTAPRAAQSRRRQQLDMIEDQLLSDATLAELKRGAAAEAKGKPAQ